MPTIIPRSTWGPNLPTKGTIEPEEVRFLIIHHTQEPGSDYKEQDVPRLLTGMYDYHTGADKGWPDLAYNFLIDKFGNIYEGRTGSIDGPVQGSATGGNQGFTQLCCFIGDYSAAPPPQVSIDSMLRVLAWLADRYDIDTQPGSSVEFTSRGSNRWKEGTTVVTPTICGHRDMSMTECPGDATYPLVTDEFPNLVSALRPNLAQASTSTSTTTSTTTTTAATPAIKPTTAPRHSDIDVGRPVWHFAAAGGVAATAVAALVAFRRRSSHVPASNSGGRHDRPLEAALRQTKVGHRDLYWGVSDAWTRSGVDRIASELATLGWLDDREATPYDLLSDEIVPRMRTLGPPLSSTNAGVVIVLSDDIAPAVFINGAAEAWWGATNFEAVHPNGITVLPTSVNDLTVRFSLLDRPAVIRVR